MAKYGKRQEPAAPKPYEFVSISKVSSEDRESPEAWGGHSYYDKNRVSGHLEATLLVATPLHVGAGSLRLRERDQQTPLVRAHTRSGGRPVLPASTLKGMVRIVFEAISRSCVRITRAQRNTLPAGAAECRKNDSLCQACRVFGALGYQGLVRFSDAVLQEGQNLKIARMPALYAPRSRTGRYFRGNKMAGRKFYKHGKTAIHSDTPVEVCPPRSELDFRLDFDNLAPGEVGLLLTALGLGEPTFVLKVGGGKPACYGSVMVQLKKLQTWERAPALYADFDIAESDADPVPYLHAAQTLIVPGQLRELVDILEYDMKRDCPEGNY